MTVIAHNRIHNDRRPLLFKLMNKLENNFDLPYRPEKARTNAVESQVILAPTINIRFHAVRIII